MARGGKREGAGRPKGSPNVRTVEVQAKLEELGCDPIEGMAKIAMDESNSIELRASMFKELAMYIAPKRKMTEVIAEQVVRQFVISDTPKMTSEEWVKRYKPKEQTI